jgi:hypothetical protein
MLSRRLFYCSMEEFRLAALNTHLKAFRAAYDQYLSEVVKLVSIIEALPESDQYLSAVSLQLVSIIEALPESDQHLSGWLSYLELLRHCQNLISTRARRLLSLLGRPVPERGDSSAC